MYLYDIYNLNQSSNLKSETFYIMKFSSFSYLFEVIFFEFLIEIFCSSVRGGDICCVLIV